MLCISDCVLARVLEQVRSHGDGMWAKKPEVNVYSFVTVQVARCMSVRITSVAGEAGT